MLSWGGQGKGREVIGKACGEKVGRVAESGAVNERKSFLRHRGRWVRSADRREAWARRGVGRAGKGHMRTTERNLERLTSHTRGIVRDVDRLLKGIPEDVGDEVKKARERLEATLESARKNCKGLENEAIVRLHATDKVIHGKPYPFIGVAFGAGLLMGVLVLHKLCCRE